MSKPQTKFDCPFYESRGGHCKKRSYDYGFMRCSFGCNHPDDISKCFYVQKAIKDSPFLKGQEMKTTLTIEQSAELIKRGVSSDKASVKCPIDAPYRTSGIYIASVFTLTDLLSLLPKEIEVDFPNADGGIDTVIAICVLSGA